MASMDTIYQGAAIFSTHLGKFPPRNAVPPSIILRSNPDDDQDEMVARLQRLFPQECRLITAPITNVAYYFDLYEMHQYGYRFLESVLGTIARHNWNRARHVQSFAEEWINANPDRFEGVMSMSYAGFSETAVHTHGEDFGKEVFSLLQGIRMYRSAATDHQIHQPAYQSPPYGATPRSSFSHVTHQSGSNPSNSQENTPSSQRRTHEISPQSSSSQVTLRSVPTPKKSRVNSSSYQRHANGNSSQFSSSHAMRQPGPHPRQSRANTSSSQSHENGISPKSLSNHAGFQSSATPRKSRVNNSSQNHANGGSSKFSSGYGATQSGPYQKKSRVSNASSRSYANESLPSNAHGGFQNHAYGPSQGYAYATSQSHEYGASQTYAQGRYQQQPFDYVALQPNSYRRQPAIQRSKYGCLQLPGRSRFPARRDFYSDPETYVGHPQHQYVGPIIVNSSPEQSGQPFHHYSPPNHHAWSPTSQDPVTIPNPVKTVSDDARVLEMQEAASRRISYDSNHPEGSHRQPPANAFGQLPDPGLHSSPPSGSDSYVSSEQPASRLLDRDPAVISVGLKPDRALNHSDHHSTDVHQSPQDENGGFLASLMQKDQPLVQRAPILAVSEITESDVLPGSRDANATHHKRNNVKTPPDATELPQHETQTERTDGSGHKKDPFDRNMASAVDEHAIARSKPIHEKSKSSNTRTSSLQGNYSRNRSDTSQSNGKDTVWVGGLNPEIVEAKVVEIFKPYGEITKVSKIFARDEIPWAFAFVTFLTEEAAGRAIDGLNFRKYDDMILKVRYAGQIKRRGDTIHRRSPEEPKVESPNQHSTMGLAGNASPCERKGRDVTNPSLDRKYEDSAAGMSPSEQAKRLSKSKRRSGKAMETPNTLSGLKSRQNHESIFSAAQDRNAGNHSREGSESSKSAATLKEEVKNADSSSGLSESLEKFPTAEEGINITKDSLTVNESLQDASAAEQGVMVAKEPPNLSDGPDLSDSLNLSDGPKQIDSPKQSDGPNLGDGPKQSDGSKQSDVANLNEDLQNSSKVEQNAGLDLPKQHQSAEPEQDSGALADAPVVDSSMQNHSESLPRKITEAHLAQATKPQSNRDGDVSTSSLGPQDNSVSPRLPHKIRWKLQQRATKAAKQKKDLEKEQQKSAVKEVGISVETSLESILLDVKSEVNDPSGSENVPPDPAQQQLKRETDLQKSLDENPQSESIGLKESSVNTQNQVPSASKSVEAPETLPIGISGTSSADWPSLPQRVEVDRTEASPLPDTPVSTQPTKKKKKKQKNSTTVPKDVETASKPELNTNIVQKSTVVEIPLDPVHQECATHSIENGDDSPKTLRDEQATEKNCERIGPLRTESVTPTPDRPDPTTSQLTNTKSKKARKSKGKKKAKSAEGSSQTTAFPSEESAEAVAAPSEETTQAVAAPSEETTQASAVPSEEPAEASAIFIRFRPAPETPFVVDQTQDTLPGKINGKEKDQTQAASLTDGDEDGEGRTHTILPVETKKKRKGRNKNKSTSSADEPHVCSRRELTQYHYLKDKHYLPERSKTIRGLAIPDPISSMGPMTENLQDVEVEEPGISQAQAKESSEAGSAASMNQQGAWKTPEDEFKGNSLEAVVRAERFLQNLGELAHPGSGTVTNAKPLNFESAPHLDSSAAETTEIYLTDLAAAMETVEVASALSLMRQPGADLRSPSNFVAASSDVAGPSKTPPLTPQTPYTRTCTESSSSLGNLSDDESAESSTLQSEDDSTDNGGEERATATVEDGSPSPRMPPYTAYPFHPSAGPVRSAQSPAWQDGDVLEVITGVDGQKTLVKVSQDKTETKLSNTEGQQGTERDSVERRDTRVTIPEQQWGYSKNVWI